MEKLGVLERVIAFSAKNKVATMVAVLALALWGWFGLRRAPLDAIPDLSDAQVIILSEWPGRSPDLIEDQITYPLSSALLAAPKVKAVRGQSFFGASFVYVIFEDGTDIYWARSRVLEYMNSARGKLPDEVEPVIGPDASGVGWVFQYALVDKTGNRDLQELRSLQDFHVRYALASVPGVAEVASIGGHVKQYQVNLDPARLRGQSIPVSDVIARVRASNQDVGGRVVEIAGHEQMVRGRGYVKKKEDLESVVLKVRGDGTPVTIKDVGEVSLGPDMRRGVAELDGEGEAVGGIVVMRFGENALEVIERVKKRFEEIETSLPAGVEVVVTYDRSQLITEAVDTLKNALIEEMLVVSLVLFVFLLHVRSALIPVLTLPIAVLLAFIPMYYQGLTINIMSLAGIIVAIGAMVDASMIIIENIHKRLEDWDGQGDRSAVIVRAMQEVGPSIFYSLLVITIAFLPVFTLEETEGRLFKPLAYTKTWSMAFASVLAVTATPALAVWLIRGRILKEHEHPLSRWLTALYAPVVRAVVRYPKTVILAAVAAMALTVPAFLRLGNEFMPPLNEGAILYMPTAPPGISEGEAVRVLQTMDRQLRTFPEVERVFGKMGRAETATDPAPLSMAEIVVLLKPKSEWRAGVTWDSLVKEMDQKLQVPGMPNAWWMPIQTRTEMLATGIRSQLGIKVYGDSVEEIEKTAIAIEKAVASVPGTRSAFAERTTGGFYADFSVDRTAAARHGLLVSDVNEVIQTAVGGMNVSETVEGRERYPIAVRYAREYRDTPETLEQVLVTSSNGAQVPISQVAKLEFRTGPDMLRSEGGKLVSFVFVDVTGRPIADYVADARRAVDAQVKVPSGQRLEWAGQFQYLERAKDRLSLVVPITLGLVFVLLWLSTRSVTETAIVMLAVPFSLIGAVWLLYLLDYNMSIAVWVGLIALAGLDAETGVVMLLYLTIAHRDRKAAGKLQTRADLTEAIVEGAAQRIRPKLMTVLTDMIGLLPVLWAVGTGADVAKRIAAPLVGGLVTSFLLELTVYPAIFALWKGRALRRAEPAS
ncbi:MAG: efflux RND transporter permease subunit [Polyangiaceae bacterium]|nr:efflux RND transporter permease subunit [Polyangiaceae bacterium]MCL4752995.1 CusA/CzcA family heavy metal efflux RND transporter [Myxococcales bacterium]